jgi:hypothetical protein
MKKLIIAILYMAIMACNVDDQVTGVAEYSAADIEGVWYSKLPDHKNWKYQFHNGELVIRVFDAFSGNEMSSTVYPFYTEEDTIFFPEWEWVTTFESDSVVMLNNPGASVAAKRWLQRE